MAGFIIRDSSVRAWFSRFFLCIVACDSGKLSTSAEGPFRFSIL